MMLKQLLKKQNKTNKNKIVWQKCHTIIKHDSSIERQLK